MATIRGALAKRGHTVEPRADADRRSIGLADLEKLVEQIQADCEQRRNDLIKQFETELTRTGGKFYRAENAQSVCQYVKEISSAQGARLAVGWDSPIIGESELIPSLEQSGIEFISDTERFEPGEFIGKAIEADIGISTVDYALADTGSLVVLSGRGRARSVSLLPPVHVAIVKSEQIIPGLDQVFPLLRYKSRISGEDLSSAIAFITGPSRTADIEMTLVVGAHGPKQLHVILFG